MTTYVAAFCRADGIAVEIKETCFDVDSFEKAAAAAVADIKPGWALMSVKPKAQVLTEDVYSVTSVFIDPTERPVIYRSVRLIEAQRLLGTAFDQRMGIASVLVKKEKP